MPHSHYKHPDRVGAIRDRRDKQLAQTGKLYRTVTVIVEHACGARPDKIVKRAEPKKGYTAEGAEAFVHRMAEGIEKEFPSREYRLVVIAPNHFKFIYTGEKPNEGTDVVPAG